MSPLDYVPAEVPDDCKVKISPSSFASFVSQPWNWYQQQILNSGKFDYNTGSVIGSIVHYCAEQVAKGLDVDEDAINAYIKAHENTDTYDQETATQHWYEMASVLINGYVTSEMHNYISIEEQFCRKVGDGIYAAGTADVIQGIKEDCTLTDYKTYNSKTKPKTIPANYKYQLMTYVWILKQAGYNVTRIRLVYVNRRIDGGVSEKTGKPLKSYPSEVTVLTEVITEEDLSFIESMLNLCKDTLNASEKHPELRHVIWHDPRLLE